MFATCKPRMNLLGKDAIATVIGKAYEVLKTTGVMVNHSEVRDMLARHGAKVDAATHIVKMGPDLIDKALKTVSPTIDFYDGNGQRSITIGGDRVAFMPGGIALYVYDYRTNRKRKARSADLVRLARLVDRLDHMHFNSRSVALSDVPEAFVDVWGFYLLLSNTNMPISPSFGSHEAFSAAKEMLTVVAGDRKRAQERPRLSVTCCITSPLCWNNMASQTLIECARFGIPARVMGMSAAGGTAPATLFGSLLQRTAENLSGIVIHQLTNPGAPIYYGAALSILDMRTGVMPLGAIESQMMNVANSEIGKHLNMPTYAIIAPTDSRLVDAQAGVESANGVMQGALARVNHMSGGGMLDVMLTHSLEKLVIDDEINAMALRLIDGLTCSQETLALDVIHQAGPGGDFVTADHTFDWFKREQLIPSPLINRGANMVFDARDTPDCYQKAHQMVEKHLAAHEPEVLTKEKQKELLSIVKREARRLGVERLPDCGMLGAV